MNKESEIKVFTDNLRYLRKKHGFTQRQAAALLGVGVHSISLLEKGVLPPRLGVLFVEKAAKLYHVRISALFYPL